MLIPIPIGVKRQVAVQGTVWKFVACSHCREDYAYLMELEAVGEDHDLLFLDAQGSAQRAEAHAEQNLAKMGQNMVLPVPCPNCGHYQNDMVRRLKDEGTSSVPLIAGLAVAGVSLIPLAFSIPNIWIVTVAGVVIGISVMAYGDWAAARYDPNAGDPESRKARGRKYAVWGEQLDEWLAPSPTPTPIGEDAPK